MGGYGSTRWARYAKKDVVEDCLTLSIFRVVGPIIPDRMLESRRACSGSLVWTNKISQKQIASVGFHLSFGSDGSPRLQLVYTSTFPSGEKQESNYPIRLVSTAPYLGGVRWWFSCPACGRRVGKLYLPPSVVTFKCRHCHGLTYTSAQTAHRDDRGGGLWGLNHLLERLRQEGLQFDRQHGHGRKRK